MTLSSPLVLAPLVAFVASVVLTFTTRLVATKIGAVSRPRNDRWNQKTTALFGGFAFTIASLATLFLLGGDEVRQPEILAVLGLSFAMFVLGLIDDVVHLAPQNKLVPQIIVAAVLVYLDIRVRWTGIDPIDSGLTVFWIVGITNAVNLLDNMDGLASGIIAIACTLLSVFFVHYDQLGPAIAASVVAAACLGFLVFNFNPASIFMGDCGSLFLGFFTSSLTLLSSYGRSRSLLATLGVPVLILLVPVFDTTFVTVVRKLAGRPISQGGKDHTSHRLVALGLSERGAVLALWGLSAISGGVAIWARIGGLNTAVALAVPLVIVVTFIGIYLAKEKTDVSEEQPRGSGYVVFLARLAHKRRIFEILLDIVLVLFAFFVSHLLRYDGVLPPEVNVSFVQVLPLLLGTKISTMAILGLYRGVWKHTGIADLVRIARAVVMASVVFLLVGFFVYRLDGISRSVLIIDCLLLLLLVGASRVSFRILQTVLSGRSKVARRALIFGAGDGGLVLLREMRNNARLKLSPIGFVDDDERLVGRTIQDLRVLGGREDIPRLIRDHRVSTIIVSSDKITLENQHSLDRVSLDFGVEIRRLRLEVT